MVRRRVMRGRECSFPSTLQSTMHYVRFLKPPQVSNGILTAKLTVTTDLGDDFLNADLPIQLIIHHSDYEDSVIGKPLSAPSIVHWKAGSRELAISILLPKKEEIPKERNAYDWRLLAWPCLTGVRIEEEAKPQPIQYSKKGKPLPPCGPKPFVYSSGGTLLSMSDVLQINRQKSEDYQGVTGLVLAAESATFNLVDKEQKLPAAIERNFKMNVWNCDEDFELVIEEETGNSIARHIWYVYPNSCENITNMRYGCRRGFLRHH